MKNVIAHRCPGFSYIKTRNIGLESYLEFRRAMKYLKNLCAENFKFVLNLHDLQGYIVKNEVPSYASSSPDLYPTLYLRKYSKYIICDLDVPEIYNLELRTLHSNEIYLTELKKHIEAKHNIEVRLSSFSDRYYPNEIVVEYAPFCIRGSEYRKLSERKALLITKDIINYLLKI